VKPNNPSRLFNRELSWLFFNTRVLEEAENPDVPLLERVRFLSISASNLDEFYMVRVAGLREQVRNGLKGDEFGGDSPEQQLHKINRRVGKILSRQNKSWRKIQEDLAAENINVLPVKSLSNSQLSDLKATFDSTILPLLTPLSVDPAHPFPFIPNFGFGIILGLEKPKRDPLVGVITIPLKVPRIIEINSSKSARNFVFIEDVLQAFAKDIYPDFDVTASGIFRITRDSGIAVDERAEDLVELKARFDEASNMRWARDLERAGVQVVYGFVGYKTHAKVSLVIRREQGELQTYTHLGTGNYHEQNAKIYTDLALFTADKIIGEDVGQIFNFVTSYNEPKNLKKLSIAPLHLRETLIDYIDREILNARAGRPAQIWAKMNALVDPIIIEKLYGASQSGVKIDLVVRGICCLRPQVKGMSENIRVKSIIGRFLEHSRIVCFGNGAALPSDQALVFISSADWMPRNLNRRIETLVPVESPTVHNQVLDQIMIANLLDNTNSWELQATGRYVRVQPEAGKPRFSAHQYFMENPSLSGRGAALASSAPRDLEESALPTSQIFQPKLVS